VGSIVKTAIAVAAVLVLSLTVACSGKKAPADGGLDPAKKVTPEKSSEVDPNVEKDIESLPLLDEFGEEGSDLKITLVLTREQVKDVERQREENAAAGTDEVTLEFTPEQIDAITRLCPTCKATSVTAPANRFAGRTVLLYLDGAGGITAAPKRYRPR
jgi:hypothetical protein